jgi:hypothetical protein
MRYVLSFLEYREYEALRQNSADTGLTKISTRQSLEGGECLGTTLLGKQDFRER